MITPFREHGTVWPICYDIGLGVFEALGLRHWRRSVVLRASGRVLEIGAGTGRNLPYYGQVDHLTVTDPDRAMLGRARARAALSPAPVEFVMTDAQALPFGDACFDAVVATLVFCSIPDPATAFAEIRRVLKPGGTLELLEHVRSPRRWAARLQDAFTPSWMRLADGCHLNRPTLEMALAAGFEPIEVHRGLDGWLLSASLGRDGGELP